MEGGEQGVVGLGEGLVDGLVGEGGEGGVGLGRGQDLGECVCRGIFEDGLRGEVDFWNCCGAE